MMRTSITAVLASLLLLGGCSDEDNPADENPYAGYSSAQYAGEENWLCRPDLADADNVCSGDIAATIVFADGSTQLEASPPAIDAPVDCFYVYPTVSNDPGGNSDLVADSEIRTTLIQAARYRSVCNLYAPLYRQVTLAGLRGEDADFELAYGDVLDAFKQFVARADGRGFMLVGHSQGTAHLMRLIADEIETQPWLEQRMIAAHLIGISVALPNDAELGATFKSTPPCTVDNDIHCFVNYVSFRESVPPEESNAVFGFTDSPDTRAVCTNPNRLGGGRLLLDSYFSPSDTFPYVDQASNRAITTPLVKTPGLVLGECIEQAQDGAGYLAISVDADPSDPRADNIGGDFLPGWGLHLVDINLAQGDLLNLADVQIDTWLASQR
jgi:hypothetical protein